VRRDAKALEEAGAFAIVLEKVPAQLAAEVSKSVAIPSSASAPAAAATARSSSATTCSGLYTQFHPRFVRRYAELGGLMKEAFERYATT
jgi:3-methyl-2-oxobutanoate hydroxymethyltransferase